MGIKPVLKKAKSLLRNYRYAAIVLIVGLALMLIPNNKKNDTAVTTKTALAVQQSENIETALVSILKQIDGVGNVELLLTLENNGETVYQADSEIAIQENGQDCKEQIVLVTDADRNQTGLVKKHISPTYRGAVVVCSGGDDPIVKLAVTQAVMRATNLNADQICVLKMK